MTEEIQLVEQLVGGSKSAFKKIYDKYNILIYNNIRKIVTPTQEAEDLLQEVFAVLWLKRASINPEVPIGNWLFVVSYNKSISFLKKQLREKVEYTSQIEATQVIEDTPTDEDLYSDQVAALEDAIGRLPAHKQRVIRLYYFEQKDCEAIAQELNLTTSSVRFYLKQARALIRESIYTGQVFTGATTGIGTVALLLLVLPLH